MKRVFFLSVMVLTILLTGFTGRVLAQDPIERVWFNEEKTAKIQIYKAADSKFYGKIIWLKEPVENGKPKVDDNNPNAKLRNQPIIGLQILKGFEKDGKNEYEDGTIYDPENGKTYKCEIKMKGNTLDVRGYIGISLIGRTTKWTLAE